MSEKITEQDRESLRKWARHIGKIKSPAKAKAARENGKKGGRPPRVKTN